MRQTIWIGEEVHKGLKEIAESRGMTVGKLGEQIIKNWIIGKSFVLPKICTVFNTRKGK